MLSRVCFEVAAFADACPCSGWPSCCTGGLLSSQSSHMEFRASDSPSDRGCPSSGASARASSGRLADRNPRQEYVEEYMVVSGQRVSACLWSHCSASARSPCANSIADRQAFKEKMVFDARQADCMCRTLSFAGGT
eukprot:scaffold7346_cov245-Pinguiococcus_pyrenoidosus.AAC.3